MRGGGFGLELGSCPVSPLDFGITRFYGCLRKRCVQLGPQVLADNSAHRPYYVLLRGMGMAEKTDVWQGTLALMVLKTLEVMGPIHGYGIARRIEQISGDRLEVNYGTLYPALLKLEQEGSISSEWGVSENNRRAKYYKLTRAGRKQIKKETQEWKQTTAILARFLSPAKGRL